MGFKLKTACAVALATTALCAPSFAGEFKIDRLIVLGDSLSDGGAYSQSVIAQSGGALPVDRYRFTDDTLPSGVSGQPDSAKIYAEHIAGDFGLTLDPNIINGVPAAGGSPLANDIPLGGFNFAQGGSRVSNPNGTGRTDAFGITTVPVVEQVDRLLAASPQLNPTDLVIVWAGANDVFAQAEANGPALIGGTPEQMAAAQAAAFGGMTQAANELVGQVDRLRAAGAQNLVVVTVPDIGTNTPDGASSPAGGLLTGLTNQFNNTLVNGVRGKASLVDANAVLSDVLSNPARYGFDDIPLASADSKACPDSSLGCVQGVSDKPDGLNQVYADGVHPSAAAHRVLASIAGAGLIAVTQNGAIPVATLGALRQQSIGLENRLNLGALYTRDAQGERIRRPVGDVEVYGGAEFGFYSSDQQQVLPGFDATTQVVKAAADVAIADGIVVGAGASLDHGQLDFDDSRGGFDSRLFIGAIFGVAELTEGIYANAAVGGGYVDVYDITRSFQAGPARESYSGDTDGSYFVAKAGLGAMVPVGDGFVINPSIGFAFERVSIGGYVESAENGSGLGARNEYGDLDFEGHRATAALAAYYRPPSAQDWTFGVRGSYEYDFNNDDVVVTYGPRNDGGPSLIQSDAAPRPDGKFGFVSGTVTKAFGDSSSLTLQGATVVGLDGVDGYTASLLYKVSF